MIHRLALRVVPRLALAVTADSVRKRKRWVMLASGLVAFLIYRLLKLVVPLSDPLILLAVSGLLSAVTAGCVYGLGRGESPTAIWKEDGVRRLSWVVGWIGFVYGVQLSLMVLALLKVFVNYDFLVHPDGPAMIAILIACTSVARDAFEIGHVRRIQRQGEPILTFPDGAPLRALFLERPWSSRSGRCWAPQAALSWGSEWLTLPRSVAPSSASSWSSACSPAAWRCGLIWLESSAWMDGSSGLAR